MKETTSEGASEGSYPNLLEAGGGSCVDFRSLNENAEQSRSCC
jgi:hypothetical protein